MATHPSRRGRSKAAEGRAQGKERQILEGAVRVFARKGFHDARVSDIAREAGVAYGLVYHYFSTKDEVLHRIFEKNWGVVLRMMESVMDSYPDFRSRVGAIFDFVVNVYKISPHTVEVLVLEFGRSSRFSLTVHQPGLEKARGMVRRIMEDGQARREVRADMDARLLSALFLGLMETSLATFVTGIMKRNDRSLDEMRRTVVGAFVDGVTPRQEVQRGL